MDIYVSNERVPLPGRAPSCVEGRRLVTGTRCEGPIIELASASDFAIHRIPSAVLAERSSAQGLEAVLIAGPLATSLMTAMETNSYVRPRP